MKKEWHTFGPRFARVWTRDEKRVTETVDGETGMKMLINFPKAWPIPRWESSDRIRNQKHPQSPKGREEGGYKIQRIVRETRTKNWWSYVIRV